jgi:hypothetical protein
MNSMRVPWYGDTFPTTRVRYTPDHFFSLIFVMRG